MKYSPISEIELQSELDTFLLQMLNTISVGQDATFL